MEYQTLLVERREHVGWLVFNRPEVLNACNTTMAAELTRAWRELNDDDGIRVIVNTGNGRAFQTGVDLKEVVDTGGMERASAEHGPDGDSGAHGLTARDNGVWKPVICAVNGICAGGGFHFVGDADVVVASRAASFFDPHVSVGQPAALEPIGLLGRLPFSALMRMMLMGRFERLDAERAYELGLVTQVIDPDQFDEIVQQLATTMARNSPSSMMLTKRIVWNAFEHGRAEARETGLAAARRAWGHHDTVEGPAAFADKREPKWASPNPPQL